MVLSTISRPSSPGALILTLPLTTAIMLVPEEPLEKISDPAGKMTDFMQLPHGAYTLENVTVPACLLGLPGDLIRTNISVSGGAIAAESIPGRGAVFRVVLPVRPPIRENPGL